MAKSPGAPSGNIDLTKDIPGKYKVYYAEEYSKYLVFYENKYASQNKVEFDVPVFVEFKLA